jgi:hypothetical protein
MARAILSCSHGAYLQAKDLDVWRVTDEGMKNGTKEKQFDVIVLTVNSCIKVRLDLQMDKSPVVVKGPFFPRVVNPRYRICGTNV